MKWWEFLLMLAFVIPLFYLFFVNVILYPILDNRRYRKKYKLWDEEHPNLQRILCKTCKFSINETYFEGRYPYGFPRRCQKYCTLTKRNINAHNQRCILAEPPEYFCEPKNKIDPYPSSDAEVYYSAYGNCYHSTRNCRSIKNSRKIYTGKYYLDDRYPCPKCWNEIDGILYPKHKE